MSGQVVLIVALVAIFLAVVVLAAVVLGVARPGSPLDTAMGRRMSIYTLAPGAPRRESAEQPRTALGNSAVARGAVDMAERVVRHRGFEDALSGRLEGAALPIRTAEWLLIHVSVAVLASVLMMLVTRGNLAGTLLGLVAGLAAPWLFLVVRAGRRENAFLAQLPDTLQMLAGSLQAGYSLPQAIDTVVREAEPPVSLEFNRALIENRLGMPVEDALGGIAGRMSSDDFSWVVMAITVQREVGGNLAELLVTVADTLRERERLRRQVRVLSAEGKLSGWILGCLPLVFTGFLLATQPSYLTPMTTPLGLILVALATVLLVVGGFWTARVIKVEV